MAKSTVLAVARLAIFGRTDKEWRRSDRLDAEIAQETLMSTNDAKQSRLDELRAERKKRRK